MESAKRARRRKAKARAAEMAGEKCSKTDDAPLTQIEWMKKNLLHQLERFAERFEYLDLGFDPVHSAISTCLVSGIKRVR
jgi:hypothetical protein